MIKKITICVEWKKSQKYGYNPHLETKIETDSEFEIVKSSASGAGYDKVAFAIVKALEKSILIRTLVEKVEMYGEDIFPNFKRIIDYPSNSVDAILEAFINHNYNIEKHFSQSLNVGFIIIKA